MRAGPPLQVVGGGISVFTSARPEALEAGPGRGWTTRRHIRPTRSRASFGKSLKSSAATSNSQNTAGSSSRSSCCVRSIAFWSQRKTRSCGPCLAPQRDRRADADMTQLHPRMGCSLATRHESVQAAGRPDVDGAFTNLLDGRDTSKRQEETKMVGEVPVCAGDGVTAREVFGLERVTVRRQNLALAFPVAGLALSAAKLFVTAPGSATAICMLLAWRTPPRSDLFDSPLRRRLSVVSLFPKACRKR
jgi:hypothetical protein